jgi:tetratricopeptide (TPR) repeat protein
MTKLFSDAQLNWDLETLFADLAAIKSSHLTEWEKTCLRGLLCGIDPEAIASQIFWTTSALRTELSRRIYPLVSALVNQKVGSWYKVAQLLEKADYKYPKLRLLPQKLLIISAVSFAPANPNLIRANAIIYLMKSHIYASKSQIDGALEKDVGKIIEGDLSVAENNLVRAIACYRDALTIAPQRLSVVAKIAKCYADLEFYRDCWYLSDYLLQQIEEAKDSNRLQMYREKSNVYHFLGDIFQKLALKKDGSDCVKIAFDFYQQSLYFNPWDVGVSWKIVELFISVLKDAAIAPDEKIYYQDRARKAFLDFQGNAARAMASEAQKLLPS